MRLSQYDSFFLYDISMKIPTTYWTPIWSQAMAKTLINGMSYKNKTSIFQFRAYIKGTSIRLRFSNVTGKSSIILDSVNLWKNNTSYRVTLNQNESIVINKGDRLYSDVIKMPIEIEDEIEVRIHFKTAVHDLNYTEANAQLYHGDQTKRTDSLSNPIHSMMNEMMGIYTAVPVLDLIEIETIQEPKVLVAFGDSITAMNQWVKPLRERIHQKYQGEFCLMNAGISGNCFLYEIMRPFANLFGRKGVDRFETDVLDVEHLHTIIFALGINDMSYYHKKTKDIINFENYTQALMKIADQVHAHKARIVVCTLTPRIGFKLLKFTNEMEMLRTQINAWIRSCGYFDEVFDMDAVIRDSKHPDVIDARYHQGDHLHPNKVGGQKIADAFDLDRLVGREV
ncbi:MAG TPA: hypothetical protein DIC19_04795 [Erysipelotrichaceae bacterium]|nr:hypothetical protein [Erysipelotrichaceae bacterium]